MQEIATYFHSYNWIDFSKYNMQIRKSLKLQLCNWGEHTCLWVVPYAVKKKKKNSEVHGFLNSIYINKNSFDLIMATVRTIIQFNSRYINQNKSEITSQWYASPYSTSLIKAKPTKSKQ